MLNNRRDKPQKITIALIFIENTKLTSGTKFRHTNIEIYLSLIIVLNNPREKNQRITRAQIFRENVKITLRTIFQ